MSVQLPLNIAGLAARLDRPVANQATSGPMSFWNDEVYAYLQSQGDRYRSAPIYFDAVSTVSHYRDKPIVAGRALCNGGGIVAGMNSWSSNALIRDKWHDLKVTMTGATVTFDTTTQQRTVTVAPLAKALEHRFVLAFPGGSLRVVTDAPIGATSLTLQKFFGTNPGWDVTVANNHVGTAQNGYFFQRGCPAPMLENMVLAGDPFPIMDDPRIQENARTYACDGIVAYAMGGYYDNLILANFPGHGLWVSNPTNLGTTTDRSLPFDVWECHIGSVSVYNALAGITLNATDGQFDTLVAAGCRDYGVRLTGGNIQGGKVHTWGCKLGVWATLGGHFDHLEGENCDYGANIFTTSEQGILKVWGNRYRGLLLDCYETTIGAIHATHSNNETTGAADTTGGVYPTGYALVLRGFNDHVICERIVAKASNGANGFCFGQDNNHNNAGNQLAGSIIGDGTGAYGLDLRQHLMGSKLNFHVGGYMDEVYIRDNVTLFGNKIDFYGTSNSTIRWPGESAGVRHSFDPNTSGGPSIPNSAQAASPSGFVTGIASSNNITFHVY